MAIIYSYPETTMLLPTDMLIGTSTIRVAGKKKNITKNFTLDALKNFILQGYSTVAWGSITGTLSNQTDLQAALNAKQGNITLTTTGSTGVATLIGNTLNIPNYALGIVTPTLNQVLTAGNVSLLDAKVGNLYSYDTVNADYGIVQFYDSGVSLKAATTNNLLFFNDDTGTVSFSNGAYDPILNFAGVGNNVYTFQNANGTLAFLSDIPSLAGYVPTSRTLTINGTAYDLTADRSWSVGTVTSVGMTVPSAFSVTPSSITTSGTFAIAGAGTASQYVRGDGTLANFPTSTGGGASVSYYLNGSISQGTIGGVAYKEMNGVPVIGAGTDFTINANGYIAQFITDVGDPNKLLIPAGNWNFETYFSASSNGGSPRFYIELYKYDGSTFTLISSSSATPENITGGTSIDLYFTALAVPSTSLLITDRLAVRFYVIHSGRTITMHTENSHLSQIITTFSSGLTALDGLTSQVQYLAVGTAGTDFNISSVTDTHTFNLPTASATNRGALSSADWSAFNGKFNLPSLTSGSVLFSNGTTIAQNNANLFWDDTNNRLGIGTTAPANRLTVLNSTAPAAAIIGGGTSTPSWMGIGTLDSGTVPFIQGYNNLQTLTTNISINPSGGNVGIGITTPEVKLDVYGSGTVQSRVRSASGGDIRFSADTFGRVGTYSASDLALLTSGTEKVRITTTGSVGIGTTTPTNAKLKVSGSSASGAIISEDTSSTTSFVRILGDISSQNLINWQSATSLRFATSNQDYSSFSERMRITDTGNVGIGTTAPNTKLEVGGSVFGEFEALRLVNTANVAPNRGTSQTFYIPALTGSNEIGGKLLVSRSSDNVGSYMAFSTTTTNAAGVTEKMRITSAGNVGIGTTAPTAKLQVVGLVEYATNALAIAGGLTVGAFYHTAGVVKVVI